MKTLLDAIEKAGCVAAMTGAGVSTLCGIPDFRGPKGLYRNPDAERIFDIDWFDRDPSVYYRGCSELVYGLGAFKPGPVHDALRRLELAGRLDGIITQNIDMLHQKAGSTRVWEVHGSPIMHHCRRCGRGVSFDEVMTMIDQNGGTAALASLAGGKVWHHVALVIDRTKPGADAVRFYVNYERATPAGRAWDASATMLDAVLTVGAGFTGYIDDLRVSAGALSPSEFIQASARTYVPDGSCILIR